ncbi:protein-(glutamine-N5) methyltransferase, release factor-specific, partial [Stenotrophomonas lactitubi]|nr:protein-(glutamine-N5) methyltransferase, release factor-specific [Stenotrophomonas lactitubi]
MSLQPEPTLRQVVTDASTRLGGVDARHEAELLLLHVLERPRSWLFA